MFYDLIACAIAAICFLVASWASTGVRLFVRIHLGNGPFLDDYLAVVSLLLFTVTSIISIYCHFKGYIPLAIYPSPEYGREGLKYIFICQTFYSVGTYLMEVSFTCTLRRLIQTRLQYAILLSLMITGPIINIGTLIYRPLFCRPTSYYWNSFGNPNTKGECDVYWASTVTTLIQAAWILFADVVLGLVIPFMLLHGMMMHYRTKLSIRILLGLSSITCIATIVRLVYLGFGSKPTLTWAVVPMAFWSLIEHGMNFICVAASTWKPLFVTMGLVDPRDQSSPLRMNTADREVFGGSTRVHESNRNSASNTNTNTSLQARWGAPFARAFYDREKRAVVRENAVTLSPGSSQGEFV